MFVGFDLWPRFLLIEAGYRFSRLAVALAVAEDGVVELWDAVVVAGKLSTEELLTAAQAEVNKSGADVPAPHLVALQRRATQVVFDAAAYMLVSDDSGARELGALILRELGSPDEAGRRPFSSQAVPLLTGRLSEEHDPRVLGWIISALGHNAARESLDEVLPFAEHPHWRVRFHVAAALPALVNPDEVESRAADELLALCRDDYAETRYYALYALLDEVAGVDPDKLTQAITALRKDPDEQIRAMARARRVDA